MSRRMVTVDSGDGANDDVTFTAYVVKGPERVRIEVRVDDDGVTLIVNDEERSVAWARSCGHTLRWLAQQLVSSY